MNAPTFVDTLETFPTPETNTRRFTTPSLSLSLFQEQTLPKLTRVNWANLASFILNCAVTFGFSAVMSLPDNSVLSKKYQTLVTPQGWAFSIWGIIFTAQAIFVVMQMLPRWRSNTQVQNGMGYWFAGACVVQSFWTIFFALEIQWAAFGCMASILLALLGCVRSLALTPPATYGDYWLFHFPISVHLGWIACATA